MEIDLTKITPLYRPLAEVQSELGDKGVSVTCPLSVSVTPLPSCSSDLIKKEDIKPEIKVIAYFCFLSFYFLHISLFLRGLG